MVVAVTGTPPSPRDRHVAVVWGSSFYVFAGFDGTSRVNDFHEFSFGSNSWAPVRALSGVAPTPRHSHSAVVYKDSFYVFGGYDGSYRCDFHEFNFTTCAWSGLASDGSAAASLLFLQDSPGFCWILLLAGGCRARGIAPRASCTITPCTSSAGAAH